MTSGSDDRMRELFTTVLGGGSVLLPFAEAVVRHLNRFREDRVAANVIVEKVAYILAAAGDFGQPLPVELLLERPELLASFFQNADLLPAGAPEAARVARLVITAMESLDAEAG
jgi:hypothetical protein